jgi:hypothetical protein
MGRLESLGVEPYKIAARTSIYKGTTMEDGRPKIDVDRSFQPIDEE